MEGEIIFDKGVALQGDAVISNASKEAKTVKFTGLGLDRAKSLLKVTSVLTFLDLIAKQVASMKALYRTHRPELIRR